MREEWPAMLERIKRLGIDPAQLLKQAPAGGTA
jgi:hypothetical protein